MDHVRHEAALDRKGEDGATRRAHLEEKVRRGSTSACAALEGPDCPESMAYLKEWAYRLCGRSGVSMAGLAPLRYSEIDRWASLMRYRLSPLEVEALILLDAAIREPEPEDAARDEPEPLSAEHHAWPEKRNG